MKKIFAFLMLGVLLLPVVASAEITGSPTNLNSSPDSVIQVINRVINYLFLVLIIIAIFIIILAAFTFLTSAGEPEKIAKARNYILYAIVAIVVAFLAEAIVMLVQRIVTSGQ
jgi:hypothetical protein